ncbi:UNVERIFIED_CONTAM: hypothetical protein Sindi_0382000 [Sesamum indicum]
MSTPYLMLMFLLWTMVFATPISAVGAGVSDDPGRKVVLGRFSSQGWPKHKPSPSPSPSSKNEAEALQAWGKTIGEKGDVEPNCIGVNKPRRNCDVPPSSHAPKGSRVPNHGMDTPRN